MVDLSGWFSFFSAHPTGLFATLLFVLVVSIAGNIIPFFPTPYLLVVVQIAIGDAYQGIGIIPLAAFAALGAASGKLVS